MPWHLRHGMTRDLGLSDVTSQPILETLELLAIINILNINKS